MRPLVRRKRVSPLEEPVYVSRKEILTVFFHPPCSFTDLLKLPRLPSPTCSLAHRSISGRNEFNLGQFDAIFVLEHDASHGPVSLASDDHKALIGSEPYLEAFLCPVGRRTDLVETEMSEKRERLPGCLNKFP